MNLQLKIRQFCRQSVQIKKRKYKNLNKAPWSNMTPTNIEGKPSKRLIIILLAKGCEWAKKRGGPCTMCNFWIQHDERINAENLIAQFKNEIKLHDFKKEGIEGINIFNAGSFLNVNEVPEKAQLEIIKAASKLPIKKVLIESRPEYVEEEKIKRLKRILGKKILEVGIGLESSSKFIRETCINKGFNLACFEKAARTLKESNAQALVYVLVKPAFLNEKEAIVDAVKTAKYVFWFGKKIGLKTKVAFEPILIKSPSLVYTLWKKRQYSRVWLWSVIEILKQVYNLGNIQVGISPEGMRWYEMPRNCKKCTKKVIGAIAKFNSVQDIGVFDTLDCECKEIWKQELKKKALQLKKRVANFFKR